MRPWQEAITEYLAACLPELLPLPMTKESA
jgi:hypothetical protein